MRTDTEANNESQSRSKADIRGGASIADDDRPDYEGMLELFPKNWGLSAASLARPAISQASTHSPNLFDRPANHARRLAGFQLMLNLDKRLVGGVESSRKDRGDVEGHSWIASKHCRSSAAK